MADDVKEKKEEKPVSTISGWELVAVVLLGLLLLNWLSKFQSSNLESYGTVVLERIGNFFVDFVAPPLELYIIFANILSIILLLGIIYSVVRTRQVEESWDAAVNPRPEEAEAVRPKNIRWQTVTNHINSDNPSEWRLAILEADIVLDDLLDSLGYVGDTIGDKLKAADPAHFRNLNNAWEAHKIRNAIAHEGADFTLTQREARRIIDLYESVFVEFNFI